MKNLLILGATSGMAQAVAKAFVADGWSLTLAARDVEHLNAIASDLRIRSQVPVGTVAFDAVDCANHAAWYEALETRPDAVLCAFGYMGDPNAARGDFEEVQQTIAVNYTGAISILNQVANEFEQRGAGTIIGISSVAGDRGRQSNYMYGSAKAGFSAYLSGLRNRLASVGVQVLTVKPGFVRTRMTENMDLPAALTAEPEQVGAAVLNAVRKKRNILYVLWMWGFIMWIIRCIPESIFKRMKL